MDARQSFSITQAFSPFALFAKAGAMWKMLKYIQKGDHGA